MQIPGEIKWILPWPIHHLYTKVPINLSSNFCVALLTDKQRDTQMWNISFFIWLLRIIMCVLVHLYARKLKKQSLKPHDSCCPQRSGQVSNERCTHGITFLVIYQDCRWGMWSRKEEERERNGVEPLLLIKMCLFTWKDFVKMVNGQELNGEQTMRRARKTPAGSQWRWRRCD